MLVCEYVIMKLVEEVGINVVLVCLFIFGFY